MVIIEEDKPFIKHVYLIKGYGLPPKLEDVIFFNDRATVLGPIVKLTI